MKKESINVTYVYYFMRLSLETVIKITHMYCIVLLIHHKSNKCFFLLYFTCPFHMTEVLNAFSRQKKMNRTNILTEYLLWFQLCLNKSNHYNFSVYKSIIIVKVISFPFVFCKYINHFILIKYYKSSYFIISRNLDIPTYRSRCGWLISILFLQKIWSKF